MKRSTNTTTKKTFIKSVNAITGDEMTADPFGFDIEGGTVFGEGTFGGIAHFNKVTKLKVQH